ncbi:FtsX-like permease family protein [Streptomyces sp. Rer75]|uniref:FtsX-like permease family protein n=1 Tax=Streptomyces sp. Rer75 TaxID=2750011 RepID=UPI0015CFED04|nr:ABC transporter permease [Streptomyces sp. Rer75]QLH24731.1 FtsX-like permease family protein [Streptomyces sp. Rer75]
MLRLALGGIRHHRYGFIGALCASALAAMLLAACGVLIESGLRAVPETDRFGATAAVVRMDPDLVVRTGSGQNVDHEHYPLDQPPRMTERAVDAVRAVDGVGRVVADTPFYAQAVGTDGVPLAGPEDGPAQGHAWEAAALTPFTLRSGQAPGADDEVAVDASVAARAHLKAGDTVRVVTDSGTQRFRVSGVAAPSGRDALPDQSALFFSAATAERLSRAGGEAAAVGVFPARGVDADELAGRLKQALDEPGTDVLTGDARAEAGAPETTRQLDDATLLFGPMAGFGGFLAVFVLGGTIALGVLQRTHEIALLRAVGATPWQVRRVVTWETVLAACLGLVPGFALAVPLATVVLGTLRDRGSVPSAYELVVGPVPFLIAAAATLLLALLAGVFAAGRVARIRAADALQEAAAPRRIMPVTRLLLALVALGGGIALFLATQHIGGEVGVAFQYLVVMLLMGAAVLLGPLLTRVLEPPLGALVSWIGATGRLAHANSRTSVRRVASVASALMLTTTMACTVLLVTGSLNRITAEQTDRRTRADVVLLPRDAPGLPPDVVAAARRLPGAEAVAATRSTTFVSYVLGTPDVLGAQALDPAAAAKVLDLGLREGALTSLAKDGTVAVSRTHAKEHSLHVGDRLRGWLGDGTKVSLTVGAVFDRPLGLGDILLSERYLASHMHQKLDDSVLVRAKSGEEKRLREAAAALVRDHPTAKVTDVGQYASATRTALAQNTTGTYLVLSVLVMFTAVSVVNGLLMGTAERAREFALLRLLGASRGQISRMLYLETFIAVLIGAAVGTAIACAGLAGANGALTGSMEFSIPPGGYTLVLAGVAALALVSTALPAALALRNRADGALPAA